MQNDKQPAASNPPGMFVRADLFVSLGIFLLCLLVYVRTLAPGVLWGDSGEFQVVSDKGGLAHASGYPIYLLFGKVFTLLPAGDVAYRVNLLSAVMGGVAAAEIYLLLLVLGVRRAYGVLVAACFALNPLFWWQGIIAEVYTISTAFFAAFLICALVWERTRSFKWIFAGGLIGGLCFGLHHTVVLTFPAMLAFLLVSKAKGRDWISAVSGVALGVGLATLAYFSLASANAKTSSINSIKWSASAYSLSPSDFDSPAKQVSFLITAKQYSQNVFHLNSDVAKSNGTWYWNETHVDFGWVIFAFSLLGIIGMLATRGKRGVLLLLFGTWLILFYFLLSFNPFDLEVDFIPTYVLVAGFAGWGMQWLQNLVTRSPGLRTVPRFAWPVAALLGVAASSWTLLTGAQSAIALGRPEFLKDIRRVYPYPVDRPDKPDVYGQDVVDRVEDGALILTNWAYVYPCYFAGFYEKNKPNIEVVELAPSGTGGQLSASMLNFVRDSCEKRPVYVTVRPGILYQQYDFIPMPGRFPLYRLRPLSLSSP